MPHYRAALTYHPEIGTFRGGRGAWRVHSCWQQDEPRPFCDIIALPTRLDGPRALYMDVPRPLRSHTFVNPTVLLRVLLEQRRAQ